MSSFANKLVGGLRRLTRDQGGSVLVYTGIALPVFLGVAGLAVDVSMWHAYKRDTQSIADSAATAGALELIRRIDESDPDRKAFAATAADRDAETNGYVDPNDDASSEYDVITVNSPPGSGSYLGSDSVEAVVRRKVPTFLAGMLFKDQAYVASRAVARGSFGEACIYALNNTKSSSFKVSGSVELNLDCGIFVNSSASDGANQNGGNCVNAAIIKVAGPGWNGCFNPTPFVDVVPASDPFASLAAPDFSSMSCEIVADTNIGNGESLDLAPGRYCDEIKVTGGTLTLQEGTYIFDGGTINATGGTITGHSDGVTLYFSPNTDHTAQLSFSGGVDVDLIAPPSGAYAGVLVYVDRAAPQGPPTVTHSFTGGTSQSLEGVIYIPSQDVKYAGSSSTEAVMLIADEIDITGNAEFGNYSGSVIVNNPNLASAKLVE